MQLQARTSFAQRHVAAPRFDAEYFDSQFCFCIINAGVVEAGEDGIVKDGMVVERRLPLAAGAAVRGRVIEPELDMNRERRERPVLFVRISQIVRWLMPESRQVGPPMRSVARELEEIFPSRDN